MSKFFVSIAILIVLISPNSEARALSGTVFLSNNKTYIGKISADRNAISFWDIFRQKYLVLPLRKLYRICIWEKSVRFSWIWGSNKTKGNWERHYVMSLSTWEGKRYWGYLQLRLKITMENKTKSFFIVQTQASRQKALAKLYYVKRVEFTPPEDVTLPKQEQFLSLSGKLQPVRHFSRVYAIHYQLGIVFPGEILPGGYYSIANIMPGHHDLIFIGDRVMIFALSLPARKDLLDKRIPYFSSVFQSWIEKKEERTSRELAYMQGRYSDMRTIVVSKNKSHWELWFYRCAFKNEQWNIVYSHLLYRQPIAETCPQMFFDTKLQNIFTPLDGGKRVYNCIWYEQK